MVVGPFVRVQKCLLLDSEKKSQIPRYYATGYMHYFETCSDKGKKFPSLVITPIIIFRQQF